MKPSSLLIKRLDSLSVRTVSFIEPMECLAVSKLHDGPQWVYETKLDGYRALGIKSDHRVRLLSRRNNSFNRQYPLIVEALSELPEETVGDGENRRPRSVQLSKFQSAAVLPQRSTTHSFLHLQSPRLQEPQPYTSAFNR